ncbi:penicillin-binding protein 1A (PBP-1a) (PBP1a) [Nautilia profundicola AmH]|uniref:Penicillin-binding protein 1A (PBP-1a) (PBP1a) n=1 Tax=Nautilia profundicola (strain ATCC BAA-1463 / DSM 18972 / AmH) TaxID=598659 RepID=B9L7F4_NAUPA|nr:PBP1A family penicillin-binding protein [Nautilia profundicola]ACM92214.1 penicillin-binding protein 1A (PBP-1a) (PBP1a) [Nautilia profundicola AmH]
MFKKIFTFFLILGFFVTLGVLGYFIYLYNSTRFASEKIIYYNPPLSAKFYDRNGKLLAIKYKNENRFYVKYDDIPGRLIETLIATEDTSFFEHEGINFNAILRALIKDIKAGKKVEGASTITQQLVRNIYLNRKKTIERKLKEMIISMKVEHFLSKEDILERYLNQIYFGHGYYGIATAAYGYFHKNLKDLTLKETAMLIALPKGPSLYDPTKNYDLNIKRADRIIKRMYILGWISPSEYKQAILERPIVYKKMIQNQAPYAVDTAIMRLLPKYKDLFTRGYDIYLTIDLPTQKIAQKTIKWNKERVLKLNPELNVTQLNGAMININPQTGEVMAIVGGADYEKSKFNRAVQSRRSVGSSIKPFIYQIALNIGYNPASLIPDISRTFKIPSDTPEEDKYWKPKNYEKNTLGLITLREALVHSRNLATINLVLSMGLDTVLKEMYNFGFDKLPNNLSIALGSVGESMWKFSELYTIFSNYGTKSKVHIVKKIIIPRENITITTEQKHEYIEPDYQAYLIVNILQDVVKKGTGRNARVRGIEIAGKTGTTNDFRDAWFCGFTPNSETLVWFGNDDSSSLGKRMSGGRVSAPAFAYFYKNLLQIHPELIRKFKIPKGVKTYEINGHKELFTTQSPPPKQETYVPVF